MDQPNVRARAEELWKLTERQHGVVSRRQLLELGFHSDGVFHRIRTGRLHPVGRGVYAVGRPELSGEGRWMAAVLACGPDATLSHESAAVLWGVESSEGARAHVTVPPHLRRKRPGLVVHREALDATEIVSRRGIPVTTVHRTLLDLAKHVGPPTLEAAINAADREGLTNPERLRRALDGYAGKAGVAALRQVLDRQTFALTDSELERRFLPLARRAGLPLPLTGQWLNGFKVDFFWPDLGLVVETDGLRYHRTPAQQGRDRLRDQAHAAAGLTPLRFTHRQVRYEPRHVGATLTAVAKRLRGED
jgi:very-short-patch-repair endonuclease/predicted transcriptional regulator of viral defense system